MKKMYNPKLKCVMYEIFAGEYVAVAEPNAVLTTLLGSCVAVCLFDEVSGVAGINHFMLPGKLCHDRQNPVNDAKYGTCAIDMLIQDMVRIGAYRPNLRAKVFGAGKMMEQFSINIAEENAEFIRRYLSALKIPIIAEDLGGTKARKVYFFTSTKEVYLRRISDLYAVDFTVKKDSSMLYSQG